MLIVRNSFDSFAKWIYYSYAWYMISLYPMPRVYVQRVSFLFQKQDKNTNEICDLASHIGKWRPPIDEICSGYHGHFAKWFSPFYEIAGISVTCLQYVTCNSSFFYWCFRLVSTHDTHLHRKNSQYCWLFFPVFSIGSYILSHALYENVYTWQL